MSQLYSIKPLEWKERPNTSPIADTLLGRYAIVDNGSSGFIVVHYSITYGNNFYRETIFPTLDDAKAAAEADWQARIKEALEPVPSGWISVNERLPADKCPVLILHNGVPRIGELRWERPNFEEQFKAFRYWDDPENDGQPWEWHDVTHWQPMPEPPKEDQQP